MRTRLRVLGGTVTVAVIAAIAVPLVTTSQAQAARFTGGNLVVYRVGSGAALTNAAAPVFLDEYGPTGAKVQSIALPTAAAEGNAPLTAAGQSRSEGLLDRSADGRFLAVTGYDAAAGTTGPGGISPHGVRPVAGRPGRRTRRRQRHRRHQHRPQGRRRPEDRPLGDHGNGERLWATGGNGGILDHHARLDHRDASRPAARPRNLSSLTVQGGQLFASGILTNRLATVGTGTPATGDAHRPARACRATCSPTATPSSTSPGGLRRHDARHALPRQRVRARRHGRQVPLERHDLGRGRLHRRRGRLRPRRQRHGGTVSLAVTTPTHAAHPDRPERRRGDVHARARRPCSPPPPPTPSSAVSRWRPTSAAGPSVFLRHAGRGATVPADRGVTGVGVRRLAGGVVSVKATHRQRRVRDRQGLRRRLDRRQVPVTGLKAGQPARSRVTATDTAAATRPTVTRGDHSLDESSAPKGALGAGTYALERQAGQAHRQVEDLQVQDSPTGKGKGLERPRSSTPRSRSTASKLSLTFDRRTKAGKVKVTVDGKATTVSLYAKAGKAARRRAAPSRAPSRPTRWSSPSSARRSAKSKGTAVYLAAPEGEGLMSTRTNQRAVKPSRPEQEPRCPDARWPPCPSSSGSAAAVAGGLVAAVTLLAAGGQRRPAGDAGDADRRQDAEPDLRRGRRGRVRRADQQRRDGLQRARPRHPPTCWRRTTRSTRSRAAAGENIVTKPGCTRRPAQRRQRRHHRDHCSTRRARCDGDAVLHRLRALEPGQGHGGRREPSLTFYAQSRDAVSYADDRQRLRADHAADDGAAQGHLRVHDHRLEPGRRARRVPIHLYLPAGLGGDADVLPAGDRHQPDERQRRLHRPADGASTRQQNDGRTMNGDPQGIAPYAVTKWAAQDNEPLGHRGLPRRRRRSAWSTPRPSPITTHDAQRRHLPGAQPGVRRPVRARRSDGCFFNVVRNDAPPGAEGHLQGRRLPLRATRTSSSSRSATRRSATTPSQSPYCGQPS